jgi:hypothetical protein
MKTHTRTIIINFGDDATTWFREISAAVQTAPGAINVQFVGGACPPAFETISLRNMLLQIPGHIKLTTTAACSLPPLTCAAWLVGDERQIARDAVVWIPKIPISLMKDVSHSCDPHSSKADGCEFEESEDEEETSTDEPSRPSRSGFSRRGYIMGAERLKTDFRTLCNAINEWFPSWEFSGSSLSVEDLVEWNVIRPEWVFGGRASRTRTPPVAAAKTARRTARKPHSKELETTPAKTDADPLPSAEAGERRPGNRDNH